MLAMTTCLGLEDKTLQAFKMAHEIGMKTTKYEDVITKERIQIQLMHREKSAFVASMEARPNLHSQAEELNVEALDLSCT